MRALRSFEAAARRGSFQSAAEELFVTPSAISHQLKTLEEFLGLELFIRQTRSVSLTHAGEEYYESIHKALHEIDRSTQQLISAHKSGELHLSVTPAFLTRWLMPRISGFHEANPDIKLEISSATGLLDFDRVDTDMAIYYGDGDWPDIESHFLRHYHQVPVCSPKLLAISPVEKPEDLLKHTLLHVQKRYQEWSSWFESLSVPYKESVQGVYFSSSALTAVAAISGVGVALADVGFISEELAAGQLVVPLNVFADTTKSFYLVYQKDRVMTYAMKIFQQWIMEEMSKDVQSNSMSASES